MRLSFMVIEQRKFLVSVPEAMLAAVTSKNWYCYQIIRIHEI